MCGSQALGQIDALRAQQVRQPRRRRMQITRLWASCALLMGSKAAGAAAGAASGTASTWQHPVAGGRVAVLSGSRQDQRVVWPRRHRASALGRVRNASAHSLHLGRRTSRARSVAGTFAAIAGQRAMATIVPGERAVLSAGPLPAVTATARRHTQVKITGFEVVPFEVLVDRFGLGVPLPAHEVVQTLTRVLTDEGAEGYYLGGHFHGDQDGLLPGEQALITQFAGPLLAGRDPFDREYIWQQLWMSKFPENVVSVIDLPLWDLAGRVTGLPVHKLLGGARDKVKVYASSFTNLGMPDDYAAHATQCQRDGYRAYKIHPYFAWDPATRTPALPKPVPVDWDIETCRAVRAAVGDEMVLMYDPWGTYNTYDEALRVGRELERLGFYWYEQPMPEYRVESYVRLAAELTIPVCAPEIAEGGLYTRAEWILRRASDISRIDVLRGGITGAMKTAALCEAHGVRCER